MDLQKVLLWVVVTILFGLLVTMIVLSIIGGVREHEFITDLTGIKLQDGNELTDALCQVKYCKSHPDDNLINCKNVHNTTPELLNAIGLMLPGGGGVQTDQDSGKSYCHKFDSKTLNNLKTRYSFTKLEAEQIYMNNQVYVNYVYGNNEGKTCMKALFSLLDPLLKARKRGGHAHAAIVSEEEKAGKNFLTCYNNLSSTNKKYIDIIVSKLVTPELMNLLSNGNLSGLSEINKEIKKEISHIKSDIENNIKTEISHIKKDIEKDIENDLKHELCKHNWFKHISGSRCEQ